MNDRAVRRRRRCSLGGGVRLPWLAALGDAVVPRLVVAFGVYDLGAPAWWQRAGVRVVLLPVVSVWLWASRAAVSRSFVLRRLRRLGVRRGASDE